MDNITLTPKNFKKEIESLRKTVLRTGKVRIHISVEQEDSLASYISSGAIDSDEMKYFSSVQELVEDLKRNR